MFDSIFKKKLKKNEGNFQPFDLLTAFAQPIRRADFYRFYRFYRFTDFYTDMYSMEFCTAVWD